MVRARSVPGQSARLHGAGHGGVAGRPLISRAAVAALAAATLAAAGVGAGLVVGMPAAPSPSAPVAGDAERGRKLLATYHCGACHRIPGVAGARGQAGPPLQGIARRIYLVGELPNEPQMLRRWIADPPALVAATAMPSMGVTPRDAQDIVAYLATLE